jgi:hypothetical protein
MSLAQPTHRQRIQNLVELDAKRQRSYEEACVACLSAMVYPFASPELVRFGADMFTFFALIDDTTDVSDAQRTRVLSDIIMDALRYVSKR